MQRGDGGGARDTFDQAQQTGRGFSPEHDNFEGSSGLLFEQAMAQLGRRFRRQPPDR